MTTFQTSNKSQEKKDDSLIEKLNETNSKSLIKNNTPEDSFRVTLFQRPNNRRTKVGGELTGGYASKFITSKNTFKKNKTLTFRDKKNRNSSASETESSIKNLEHKFSKKGRFFEETLKSQNSIRIEKTLVDNIDHIYSKIKKTPSKIVFQYIFLYLIALLVGIYDWSFLFQLTQNKLERNYCYNNLNQFDSCSIEQVCKKYQSKLNFIIYNDDINVYGKNENDNTFLEEMDIINNYYKQFFLKYYFELKSKQLLNSIQIFSSMRDKSNFAIVLTNKGQWNIFLRYFFVCQKTNFVLLILVSYIIGGVLGSFIFGLQADIRGRKKIIQITLFIMFFGLLIMSIYFFYLDDYKILYRRNFDKNYKIPNRNDIEYDKILRNIYSQKKITILVNKTFIIYLFSVFLTNMGACPLVQISLSLLIESATNEHIALQKFKNFYFFIRGFSPMIASLIIVNFNNTTWSYTSLCIYSLLLFISSFFFLHESMRYLFEYCEWTKLSEFITKTFKLEDQNDIQYLSNFELKRFQREENETLCKEYEIRRLNLKAESEKDDIFEKNNYYNYYKRKKNILSSQIKRKEEIIINYKEITHNPTIILICFASNRQFIKNKYLLFSILFLLNFFLFIFQQEMTKRPFFREKDLFFATGQNYIINTNYFGLLMVILISNFFYYHLYRINCSKIIIICSYIFLSYLSFSYYIHSRNSKKTPIFYNQYNFGMMNIYYNKFYKMNQLYIHAIYFFYNGIYFYIHLFIIKISKTLYRCTMFSLHSIIILVSFIFADIFISEIKKPFLLLGFINLLCLVLILFLNEINDKPSLINDMKKNVEKVVKHDKFE